MSVLIEDVLDAWRRAERLLDNAPPGAARTSLEEALARLRGLYAELTSTGEVSAAKLDRASRVMRQARSVLDEAQRRLADGEARRGDP